VSLKTLDDWGRRDAEFAAEWDATIDRVNEAAAGTAAR
jgi:hypothetical protein